MARELELEVPLPLAGERVDKILASLLGVSRSLAKELVEQEVTVDGQRVRPSERLPAGALIVTREPRAPEELQPEPVEFGVVYEDKDVIVVEKPAGLVVHPGSGSRRGTLAAGLLHRYPELRGVGDPDRWGLVHRLDKDTSGVLVVARSADAHSHIVGQLRRRELGRSYTALVHGVLGAPTGTIDAPIGRDPARPTRRIVTQGGKPARTHYEVVAESAAHNCSLVMVQLETGRTHQIRVHFASIGHPVVGDQAYGRIEGKVRSPRMFLHSSRVRFIHPETGEPIEVGSELPRDLQQVLGSVEMGSGG